VTHGVAFAPPAGDPHALEAFAGGLRSFAGAVSATEHELLGALDGLDTVWRGTASTVAAASVVGLVESARMARRGMDAATAAVVAHAAALRRGCDEAAVLRLGRDQADTDLRTGLASLRGGTLDPFARQTAEQSLLLDHAARIGALRRAHHLVVEETESSALRLRRALENTRGPFVRDHRESAEDYVRGVASALLSTLPVLRAHSDTVAATVWAATTSVYGAPFTAGRAVAGLHRYRLAWDAWQPGYPVPRYTPSYQPAWLRGTARVSPWVGEAVKGDNLLTGAAAARGQSLRTLWISRTGVAGFVSSVGSLRGAGVLGSAGGAVVSGLNVVSQGNPVHAFEENGAGYVADVSETLFQASTTALLVAPNPVTAGVVVVTGLVYVGSEIYVHREQIGDLIRDGGALTADVLDGVGDGVGNALRVVGSALNPFD
jgi:hypothetical protein